MLEVTKYDNIVLDVRQTPFFPGFHFLFGRAKKSSSQRLKEELGRGSESSLSELQSLFGELLELPLGGYRRVFDRATTFWTFLAQVLRGGSCRDASRQVQAEREGAGLDPISSANVAYCKARARLPLDWLEAQGERVGRHLQATADWNWRGRRVLLADATSCQLADTPENQDAYPQPTTQKPGCGQPVVQLLGVFDLGSGALLGWGKSPLPVHEAALFEVAVLPHVNENDVLVVDRAYDAYRCLALTQMRGADTIVRWHSRRKCPLAPGQTEAITTLERPPLGRRPDHCTEEEWLAMPARVQVRFVRINLAQRGFRTQEVTLVTTILDAPAEDIAALFLRRWQIELCFRDIKTTLGMELLRGKSPAVAEREIAMHLLAYNLLRALMLQAAQQENQPLYRMSFAGTRDAACRFAPNIAQARSKRRRNAIIEELLRAIGTDKVPDRPNRQEPRAIKRRPKPFPFLTKPRNAYKKPPAEQRSAHKS